jgi:hypothetical protein
MYVIKKSICILMLLPFTSGCTMYNSYEAHKAKDAMVGISDYNLERASEYRISGLKSVTLKYLPTTIQRPITGSI